MVQRIGGSRRHTRYTLQKPRSERGKLSLTKYLQSFDVGDRVLLKAEPSVQEGMYHGRFHGKIAVILKPRGTCYELEINDLGKKKTLIVHPVHLRKLN